MPDLVPVEHDPFADEAPLPVYGGFVPRQPLPASFQQPPGDPNPIVNALMREPSIPNPANPPTWARQAVVDTVRPILDAGQWLGGVMGGQVQPTWGDAVTNLGGAALAGVMPPGARAAGTLEREAVPAAEAVAKGIRAYHGSPHDFERFDLSKIGTGEGAQAYGHGLYFAENEGTARSYRDALSGQLNDPAKRVLIGDTALVDHPGFAKLSPGAQNGIKSAFSFSSDKAGAINNLDYQIERAAALRRPDLEAAKSFVQTLPEGLGRRVRDPGRMYEVNINAHPDQFLDWDKPLSEQHPLIQDMARNADLSHLKPGNRTRRQIEMWREGALKNPIDEPTGNVLHNALTDYGMNVQNNAALTDRLRQAGIPGIKYLDQGSRAKAYKVDLFAGASDKPYATNSFESMEQAKRYAAEKEAEGFKTKVADAGTRNYVVFDDKLIDIIKKYGIAGLGLFPVGANVLAPVDHDPFTVRKERAAGGRVNADNIDDSPTEAQKKAGNYAKDHVSVHGLDITIENAKGAIRSGVDRGGKPWSVKMPAHYGYIKGTVGKDKDHVDVYLGPHLKSPHVFVVDQVDAETGKFDEHKAFLGFSSREQARRAYLAAFSDGKGHRRLGHMAEMSVADFRGWLDSGDTTKPVEGRANGGRVNFKDNSQIGLAQNAPGVHFQCRSCKYNPAPGGICRNPNPELDGRRIKPLWCCNLYDHAGMKVIV